MQIPIFNYVDFHTHLHWYENPQKAIEQIKQEKILTIAASVDKSSYLATLEFAKQTSLIIPTFGIHPENASNHGCSQEEIERFCKNSAIIGEIGLDSVWAKNVALADQEKIFLQMLDHCNAFKKICVIHTKGQEQKILDILKDFPNAKPIIHWFSGSKSVFTKFLNQGYKTTFGCQVKYSPEIRELLKLTPNNQLLSETDNPVGEPWLGGTDSSPLLIERIVKDIADVKEMNIEETRMILANNAKTLLQGI